MRLYANPNAFRGLGIWRYMITGWKVVVKGKRLFTHVNVLPCFDYCVANGLSTKIVKPIIKNVQNETNNQQFNNSGSILHCCNSSPCIWGGIFWIFLFGVRNHETIHQNNHNHTHCSRNLLLFWN